MANPFSLEGKNAWITGASYGIGFNIAKAFVAAGIKNIIFNDINEAALERGLANYKEAGITNVHGYVCDVTDENAVKALVEKIHAEVGQIDILVNNAGIIKRIPMHEMKRQEFQQVIDVDLVAPFIVASAVIPEMMERKEGKIINICSMMSELKMDDLHYLNVQGDEGNAGLFVVTPIFEADLWKRCSLTVSGTFYHRHTHYREHSDKDSKTYETKVGLTYYF